MPLEEVLSALTNGGGDARERTTKFKALVDEKVAANDSEGAQEGVLTRKEIPK